MKWLSIFVETIRLALQELWTHKLRAFLSLLGISIGIFCVISVQMMLDSVERSVRSSFSRLGDDVIYIDRFPWNEDPGDNFWKYLQRPTPNYREFLALQENVPSARSRCHSVGDVWKRHQV